MEKEIRLFYDLPDKRIIGEMNYGLLIGKFNYQKDFINCEQFILENGTCQGFLKLSISNIVLTKHHHNDTFIFKFKIKEYMCILDDIIYNVSRKEWYI